MRARKMLHSLFLTATLLTHVAWGYEPLEGQSWKQCSGHEYSPEYKGEVLPVSYRFCTQNGKITPSFVDEYLKRSTKILFKWAEESGLNNQPCVANTILEIYDVETNILNAPGRFPAWSNASPSGIWGLYDPRVNTYNTSSLILSDQGIEWNKLTFAHELSHYWYDRLCWNKHNPDVEGFALQFEEYFLKNKDSK